MTLTDMRLTEFMGFKGKKGYDEALYSVNKRHDITGIHDINGNFPYDDIFRKNHARLYLCNYNEVSPAFRKPVLCS